MTLRSDKKCGLIRHKKKGVSLIVLILMVGLRLPCVWIRKNNSHLWDYMIDTYNAPKGERSSIFQYACELSKFTIME